MGRRGVDRAFRLASIDIGTNSVRLLVADFGADGGFRRIFMDRRITRLGSGLQRSGRLGEEAVQKTLETLRVFVGEARRHGAERTLAAATGAVRGAGDGRAFVHRVFEQTGLRVLLLSGQQEARWMMRGVSRVWPDPPHRWMIVDLGGGSTELVRARGQEVETARSIPLGMVSLTEGTMRHDPPLGAEVTRCRNIARGAFSEVLSSMGVPPGPSACLVGTAGTITTLAALELGLDPYDGDRVNGYRIRRQDVERWAEILAAMDNAGKRRLPGMEPGREDVILAGVLMFHELMGLLAVEEIHVSDYGLLEGIALMATSHEEDKGGPCCRTTLWTGSPSTTYC
jgi:exopolyphosphatase/guanosine-5'-triphosphate,3'-diphosphate pyrophosphatase